MPQQDATIAARPRQRLSSAQMLHLMRLEVDRALRHEYAMSCMVIGLDGFKEPHQVQERRRLMPALFRELKGVTFENDVRGLGLWNERHLFAVFPHVTPEKIAELGQEMLERARALDVASLELEHPGLVEKVTLSVGISHNLHPGEITFEALIEDAETGMNLASSAGGDRAIQAKEVETEVDRLREELADQIQELEKQQESYFGALDGLERDWGKNLVDRVLDLFQREPDQSVGVLRLEKEVIALIKAEIESWRSTSSVKAMVESQRQIENLERRVRKLTESLGVTEQELQRVAAMKNVDLGLSSIYRNVQGLRSGETEAETKLEMLKNIFEANLALQKAS